MAKRPILTTTADGRKPTTTDAAFPSPAMSFRSPLGSTAPHRCRITNSSSRRRTLTESGFSNVSRMPREAARSGVSRPKERQQIYQGRGVPAGHQDGHAGALLNHRRRARQPRHVARPVRVRVEISHQSRPLRHGRQHTCVLRARPDEIPALHPLPEAPRKHQSARPH
jgi:hypothetical protein